MLVGACELQAGSGVPYFWSARPCGPPLPSLLLGRCSAAVAPAVFSWGSRAMQQEVGVQHSHRRRKHAAAGGHIRAPGLPILLPVKQAVEPASSAPRLIGVSWGTRGRLCTTAVAATSPQPSQQGLSLCLVRQGAQVMTG